jgi:hypothetical protein
VLRQNNDTDTAILTQAFVERYQAIACHHSSDLRKLARSSASKIFAMRLLVSRKLPGCSDSTKGSLTRFFFPRLALDMNAARDRYRGALRQGNFPSKNDDAVANVAEEFHATIIGLRRVRIKTG